MTVSTVRSEEKTAAARHPLAPLTVTEAGAAARLALDASGPGSRLIYCALAEPAKAAVFGWEDGRAVPREVLCVVYEKPKRLTWLVTVVLDAPARVASAVPVPGAQPPVTREEFAADGERIKQAPAFQAALARRGITDLADVHIDSWPASNFGLPVDESGRRLTRAVAYVLDGPHSNPYARPVENLVVLWDRDAGEIIELADGDAVPLPTDPGRYDAASNTPHRELAELRILQPDGPGFTIDDGQLRWGPWQLRVSLHPIEGIVLHEVTYIDTAATDGARPRPILYRASMSEMVVPYGSTAMNHWWKNAFDAGDVGLGLTANSLELGCDCLGEIVYLDGTIQAEAKLTGIIQTQAVRPGERVPYANPVTPELAGPHHQHVFGFRLDFTLDGAANAVYEVDAVPVPTGPDNPYGNAFTSQATLLETELQAQRMAAAEKSRYWKIVNHGVRNAVGEPVAYKLVPAHANAPLLAQPDAAITARAMFGTKHLWVTPFAADERRAAGDFPNQHPGGDGLPRWTGADRPVVDTDIVVWHTVGVTHFCRPEDFPVMPVEYTGFTLKPFGFFDRNPALNLAPSAAAGDHCHQPG
jgi:Cu2+-containing amine oxidase